MTTTASKMTPESQRIAIAEACGWERTMYQAVGKIGDVPFWYREGKFCPYADLPDYLNDLNEMHEAEKVLTEEQRPYYLKYLREFRGTLFDTYHSTAAQRAEAFLRTLSLWKEEPASEVTVEGLR